jgi:hypothetical protein
MGMDLKEALKELVVMEDRWENNDYPSTGIFVRALTPDGKASVDIGCLTPKSLLKWLRHCGGKNPLAENVVGQLLGHGHIVDYEVDE